MHVGEARWRGSGALPRGGIGRARWFASVGHGRQYINCLDDLTVVQLFPTLYPDPRYTLGQVLSTVCRATPNPYSMQVPSVPLPPSDVPAAFVTLPL